MIWLFAVALIGYIAWIVAHRTTMKILASILIVSILGGPKTAPAAEIPDPRPAIIYSECPTGPPAKRDGDRWILDDAKAEEIACKLVTCEIALAGSPHAMLSRIDYGPGWGAWIASIAVAVLISLGLGYALGQAR
jgi:hypothetical protein